MTWHELTRGIVMPAHCDVYGHMNGRHYAAFFDDAGWHMFGKVGVSLILKTLSNPYFVSMRKDAETEAKKDGVSLTVAAGKTDGDTQTQISAIDNAISRGDKGIIITENGNAVNSELQKARQNGLYVIALDTGSSEDSGADRPPVPEVTTRTA